MNQHDGIVAASRAMGDAWGIPWPETALPSEWGGWGDGGGRWRRGMDGGRMDGEEETERE